jgi:sec-independent protein translocase protein TatA
MPTSLGPAEILVILVVALVVLGPKRLPEAGRQIGRFVAEVRHWTSAVQAEIRDVIDLEGEPQPPPPPTAPPAPLSSAPAAPVPTPQDLGASPPSPPAPAPAPASGPSSAAEWGLAERTPTPAPVPPPATGAIPPEWATPPSSNGDHS